MRHELSTLEELLARCVAGGVKAASLRTVDEIRPRTLSDGRVEVGRRRWVEVSAYGQGELYVLVLDEADEAAASDVQSQLVAAGLTVKRRSANIS